LRRSNFIVILIIER